ncbi:WAT1-related protein At5g64700 isoform X3 [Setaria viridis]|uniref:WAT1-related protein At5g64700 isoform X3 n=1 Tax=Setaria viridis TaxID=4556 RepID=UPI001493AFB6|nr:WAT1-related protein At5g64700-like isoform X3 [Setaria viridis]
MHIQMKSTKPYVVAIIIQVIYTGMFVILKAAFNQGFSTYVFNFYCQAAASVLLLPIAFLRERNTFCINLINVALRLTSATVQSAIGNSKPVITFCFALLLRMESVKLSNPYSIAKVTGVVICLAGVFVIAFYAGPALSPVNHHRAFHASQTSSNPMRRVTWIKGTFLKLLGDIIWCLWIIAQAALLKEFPNKMLVTVTQCVFSTVQSLVVAAVAERDSSRWKLGLDVSLLAIIYTGFIVTGVCNYLQVWCLEMKGPVFVNTWFPLCFVLTMFCSSFFLGEIVHLGSILGGILLIGGLYSVLWAKSKETVIEPCGDADMTFSAQDEIEERKSEENMKGREEHKEVSAYAV